jgi:hypothetical protein
MKIFYAGSPEVPFNKPRAEAEAMIASGIAFLYVEPAPVRKPDAQFAVQIWSNNNEPYVAASCNGCGNKAQFSGPSAHRTQVFRHCGITDQIPEDVAAEYVRRRAQWTPKKPVAPEAGTAIPMIELSHFA